MLFQIRNFSSKISFSFEPPMNFDKTNTFTARRTRNTYTQANTNIKKHTTVTVNMDARDIRDTGHASRWTLCMVINLF